MPTEDSLSSRFDYLFEPLDVEESVDPSNVRGGADRAPDDEGPAPSAAPIRMAFAAFVLASLGAVAVVAVLLLQRPYQPHSPVNLPVDPAPPPTTAANVPSQPAAVPPPPPTAADSATPETIESVPTQDLEPELSPTQTPSPHRPEGGASSPTTRAPISVAPESRAPFPNQGSRAGENGGGGLLGGLL